MTTTFPCFTASTMPIHFGCGFDFSVVLKDNLFGIVACSIIVTVELLLSEIGGGDGRVAFDCGIGRHGGVISRRRLILFGQLPCSITNRFLRSVASHRKLQLFPHFGTDWSLKENKYMYCIFMYFLYYLLKISRFAR